MNRKQFRELLRLTRETIKALTDAGSSEQKSESERAQQRIFNQLIELIKMELSDCRLEYLSNRSAAPLSQSAASDDKSSVSSDFANPEINESVRSVKSNSELSKPFKYVDKAEKEVTKKPRKSIRDFSNEENATAATASAFPVWLIKMVATVAVVFLCLSGLYFIGSLLWPMAEDKSIDISRLNFSRPGKSDISATLSQKSLITESQLHILTEQELAKGNLRAAREYLRLVVTRNPTNKDARERLRRLNEQILEIEGKN